MTKLVLLLLLLLLGIESLAQEENLQPGDDDDDLEDPSRHLGNTEGGLPESDEEFEELMRKMNEMNPGMMDGMSPDMFGGGEGRRFSRDIGAVEEDIPLIQCETCKQLVGHVATKIQQKREKYKKTKVSEWDIVSMLENVCDTMREDGEWISQFDIVEEADKLVLKKMPSVGYCEEECKTIAAACVNIINEAESSLAEVLYLNKPNLETMACTKLISNLKGNCGSVPPVPKDRKAGGDNFKPKSDVDIALAEASRSVRELQEQDPNMFARDDL